MDGTPYQSLVFTSESGDYTEAYETLKDPLLQEFLYYRSQTSYVSPLLTPFQKLKGLIRRALPLAPNLTVGEWIPTRLLDFFKVLKSQFPNHHLILSDFSELPEAIEGIHGPVVQTRYRGAMVPVSTYQVCPGWFDIFFPTHFEMVKEIYNVVMKETSTKGKDEIGYERGKKESSQLPLPNTTTPVNQLTPIPQVSQILTHKEFLTRWGDLNQTRLRSGENPLVDFYKNVKFLLS